MSSWDQVISKFFEDKVSESEIKYIKDRIKKIKSKFSHCKNEESKKKKNERELNYRRRIFEKLLNNRDCITEEYKNNEIDEKIKYINDEKEKFNPYNWLDKNSLYATQVSFASHVVKLTHSSINAPSLIDQVDSKKENYLTTSSLNTKLLDGAVQGNQYAPIYQFLKLEMNGKTLIDYLKQTNDYRVFLPFANNIEDKAKEWTRNLLRAVQPHKLTSHSLLKQIYFPIKSDFNYHLLNIVVSSSLSHKIHQAIKASKQKKNTHKFSSDLSIDFPKTSHIKVTASNHGNASQFNAERGGRLSLFSCQPPIWKNNSQDFSNAKSLFDKFYSSAIKTELDYLSDFLYRFQTIELSIKTPKRMAYIEMWVESIVDELIMFISQAHELESGWTKDSKIRLKKEHQFLLDPYRSDNDFQAERHSSEWQNVILDDFARWLNRQIRKKKKDFVPTTQHSKIWKRLLSAPLRDYMETVADELKEKR